MGTLHRVDLPGLVGDEPLGFLAAIGLMKQLYESSYLSWDADDRHAILHCHSYTSVADLVTVLMERLGSIGYREAIPCSSGFPVRRRRGEPDPLRVRPADYWKLLERVDRADGDGGSWLKATIHRKATDADGFCLVHPLIAVRGRQTIGSFWYYPMCEVREDPQRLLTEALTGWRRVEGSEGWLLDHRATYSTDPNLRGPGGSMAVPGATWLATLAVREFGYVKMNVITTSGPELPWGWFHVNGQDTFVWPLWTLPATRNSLEAVWDIGWRSEDWKITAAGNGTLQASTRKTHGASAPNAIDYIVDLGIFAMCAAVQPRKGPLTPIPMRMTTRRPSMWEPEHAAWKGWDWEYPDPGDYPGRYGHG